MEKSLVEGNGSDADEQPLKQRPQQQEAEQCGERGRQQRPDARRARAQRQIGASFVFERARDADQTQSVGETIAGMRE